VNERTRKDITVVNADALNTNGRLSGGHVATLADQAQI